MAQGRAGARRRERNEGERNEGGGAKGAGRRAQTGAGRRRAGRIGLEVKRRPEIQSDAAEVILGNELVQVLTEIDL